MNKAVAFNEHITQYEEWFDLYPEVFKSEVEALREMMPEGEKLTGIEIGVGTGRFAKELGIKEGIDIADNMREIAMKRGIETIPAPAEHLPYGDNRFDFVLMNFCVSYFDNVHAAMKEAFRVLKHGGSLVLSFIDKDSIIGRRYEANKSESIFYKNATFYSVDKIKQEIVKTGFKKLEIRQTLFGELNDIHEFQSSRPGHGEGSFVVVRAVRNT